MTHPNGTGSHIAAYARKPETWIKAIGLIIAVTVAWVTLQTTVARIESGQDSLTEALDVLAENVAANNRAILELNHAIVAEGTRVENHEGQAGHPRIVEMFDALKERVIRLEAHCFD